MAFKPATKEQSKLRLALMGPSGSGKTFSALKVATTLGKKVAVIDSERGSASKYADRFAFDVCDLENHSPQSYVKNIKDAEAAGYEVLVIDSLSHAWAGKDGALEQVDKVAKRSSSGNSYTAWREVTPHHNALVDAILQSKCHVIATMRTKTEYVLEEDSKGKKVPKKIGMAPIQRDGFEYEFDVVADMNLEHDLIVTKTRCHALDGLVVNRPGDELGKELLKWLNTGSPQSSVQSSQSTSTAARTAEESATQSASSASGSASAPEPTSAGAPAGAPPSAPKENALASPEQMKQLLQVGKNNLWSRDDINGLLKERTTDGKVTVGIWKEVVEIVGKPKAQVGNE